jgi:hypothetical protein
LVFKGANFSFGGVGAEVVTGAVIGGVIGAEVVIGEVVGAGIVTGGVIGAAVLIGGVAWVGCGIDTSSSSSSSIICASIKTLGGCFAFVDS